MSRPRTPTKVLKLRGSFDKHPERRKAREHEPPETAPLGGPPRQLDEAERERWQEITTWCPWLEVADAPLVEATCKLWAKLRRNELKGGDWTTFLGYLSRLGMTPVDRSKVRMPDAPKKKKSLLA